MPDRISGLYGITPDWPDGPLFAAVETALQSGLRLLQYRHKTADEATRRRQAMRLRTLCGRHGAQLIVNDDARLACAVDADGVHLGRDDGDIAQARELVGAERLIGVSCYDDAERARAAIAAGADYVAFGAIYPSAIKPGAARAPLTLLGTARDSGWNSAAIGGITPANAPAVIAAGADAIAVIGALFQAPDIAAAVQSFIRLFDHRPS
jgi:thiamine-phosphate pyrophosphorylase